MIKTQCLDDIEIVHIGILAIYVSFPFVYRIAFNTFYFKITKWVLIFTELNASSVVSKYTVHYTDIVGVP